MYSVSPRVIIYSRTLSSKSSSVSIRKAREIPRKPKPSSCADASRKPISSHFIIITHCMHCTSAQLDMCANMSVLYKFYVVSSSHLLQPFTLCRICHSHSHEALEISIFVFFPFFVSFTLAQVSITTLERSVQLIESETCEHAPSFLRRRRILLTTQRFMKTPI